MKYLFIFMFICGCSTNPPRKLKPSVSKGTALYKRYWTKKDRHYRCVQSFVGQEVRPLEANTICIDIFRKEF